MRRLHSSSSPAAAAAAIISRPSVRQTTARSTSATHAACAERRPYQSPPKPTRAPNARVTATGVPTR
uniref:Uncharacterized protein n=1 Tax=Oryza meridionalis TaxID=40149 RepID=A0A0E0D9B8_9ORYZ